MPRIRTIKPDAFLSESLSSVPRGTRWTFAGLWTYADDKGRGRDDARLIKAALYPLDDDVSLADVAHDLGLLTGIGAVCRYMVDDRRYLHMPKWEHQKINRPTPAKSPPCPLHEDGRSGHVLLTEDSVSEEGAETPLEPHNRRSEGVSENSVSPHGALTESSTWEGKGREKDREREGKGNPEADAAGATKTLAITEPPRADVDQICEHLAGALEANGCKRPTITAKWRSAARLMLDKDGRTEDEIHGAIDWCQRDEFWRANILSLPTLREKYDTLRLQAQRRNGSSRQKADADMWDRAYARAEAREIGGAE